MAYNPVTDLLGLWRNVAGQVSKVEMPGLDYVVQALARAGLISLSVSATAPVVSQDVTAWLQTAVPSYSAEGTLYLWDPVATAYAPATPSLLCVMLQASAGQNGVSWWTCTGGAPLNTVGNNGDFAVRLDAPNGIYGPKAAGVWPANPIPGTADVITSASLDNTFGGVEGQLIIRGAAEWDALPIGGENALLMSTGLLPVWLALSTLLDNVFGGVSGSILYRAAGAWAALPPGVLNQVLSSGGPAGFPAWAPRTAEFPVGTIMLFQQTAAPLGWVKQVTINDYGLRVTSGAVGQVAGSSFSTVFAQSAVGNTTVGISQMPSHIHPYQRGVPVNYVNGSSSAGALQSNVADSTGSTGGDGPHTHSVNLSLSYIDVIIASKSA